MDPNTLNLDPNPEFWPNLDPDQGFCSQFSCVDMDPYWEYGSGSTTIKTYFYGITVIVLVQFFMLQPNLFFNFEVALYSRVGLSLI